MDGRGGKRKGGNGGHSSGTPASAGTRPAVTPEWYRLTPDEIFLHLGTVSAGLTAVEAERRLERYGPNRLAEAERVTWITITLHQFTSPLIYILLTAAVVTALLGEFVDTGVIIAAVLFNAVIGFIQEFKAEESVQSLKKMLVLRARVVRDGREQEIAGDDLVPGDVVLLASGGRVPADLRLLEARRLTIDEAMLTGESIPADKQVDIPAGESLSPGDRTNMAFAGTAVVSGRARGVAVATGPETELGRIAAQVQRVERRKAPLQEKFDRFARFLGIAIVGISGVVFLLGVYHGIAVTEMFVVAVATAVSAIPEGLPVAVTIAMAIGVARMSRRQAIVRKLPAVETLGSTTVIGSDKTGTLTRNEMTVTRLYDGDHRYEVAGGGYDPAGGAVLAEGGDAFAGPDELPPRLAAVLRIGLLCNESRLYEKDGRWAVDGDPTEGALIVAALKAGLTVDGEQDKRPLIDLLPFESELGYMATLHREDGGGIVYLKGAPEVVVERCVAGPGERDQALLVAGQLAATGLRVLAMAWKPVSADTGRLTAELLRGGFRFGGLQGMYDPPRDEVKTAIAGCREAGIRTLMITGDHAVTAAAIADNLGITAAGRVLTGSELEAMDDDALYDAVADVSVYARVSPHHKLRIATQLMHRGEIVAVTGDGVNDAPALKAAHIGVAMGITGTDVAKEAADIVLVDDNFATIFAAVEEGRVVYDNIKKVALFLVSCGFGELLAILATSLVGLPIPYNPAQILWLNLVTNGLQDVALAFEPGEPGVLHRHPRAPGEGIMSALMVRRTLLMGFILALGTVGVFLLYLHRGVDLEKCRTMALTTMVFLQFFQAANCRSERQSVFRRSPLGNPFLLVSVVAAFFAQIAVLYVPALQWIFRTVPLDAADWLLILVVSVTVVIGVEFDKWRLGRRETDA
ncbi:MAG: HAD-IC family P-type ATPase [Deltaproteobacteria bacterium]|nr:HAD-IC family P-type ATPase [Candidatus Anaeroferrophillacea bacterium]